MQRPAFFVYLAILIIVFGVFILQSTELARYVWSHHKNANLALIFNRTDAGLAMELGNFYFGGQNFSGTSGVYAVKKAKIAYQTAVRLDDRILWGHYQLSRVYFVEGNFEKALFEINRELEVNPGNLRSLYVRGLIYGFRRAPGDLELAEADFRNFIEWVPTEWAGYNDLNWVLLEQERYKEVKDVSLEAFRSVPDGSKNAWILTSLGVAHLNLREYDKAQDILTRASEASEELTEADWHKAYSANDPRSAESGLLMFKQGIQRNLAIAKSHIQ